MKNLNSLLERLSRVLNKDELIKSSVVSVLRDSVGVTISTNKINLKEGVLEVEASPAIKNEIKLKEERIKDELKEVYKINLIRILYK